MSDSVAVQPALLLRNNLSIILEELTHLSMFPKDCLCHNHKGPHIVHLTRKKAVENYAKMFALVKDITFDDEHSLLIERLLAFAEEERQRQSIFIKDLKFYAIDLYPTLNKV